MKKFMSIHNPAPAVSECAYDSALFLDIETTGFSSFSGMVFLIGAAFREENGFRVYQWLAEDLSDESKIFDEFSSFLREHSFKKVVTFNGNSFSLPFISHSFHQYKKENPLSGYESVDLRKILRILKPYVALENEKQLSYEKAFLFERSDTLSSSELISLYEEFKKENTEELLKLMLLHNESDLLSLLYLFELGKISHFFLNPEFFVKEALHLPLLTVRGTVSFSTQKKFSFALQKNAALSFYKNEFTFTIPIEKGPLKKFLPDYKNYVRLIREDKIIPKRIAGGVSQSNLRSVRRDECYLLANGNFLPSVKGIDLPQYKKQYSDKDSFFFLSDIPLEEYIKKLLTKSF